MNIFRFELRAFRGSTLAWSAALALMAWGTLALFPSFAANAGAVGTVLEGLPVQLRTAIGLSLETVASLPGFSAYVFLYVLLAGSIQAMLLGMSVLAKDVGQRTADFLLSKPVSRGRVFSAKLLAAGVLLLGTSLAVVTAVLVAARAFSDGPVPVRAMLAIASTFALAQLSFLAVGAAVASFLPRVKALVPVSVATAFAAFVMHAIGQLEQSDWMRYVNPLHTHDLRAAGANGALDSGLVLWQLALAAALLAAAAARYIRRDTPA